MSRKEEESPCSGSDDNNARTDSDNAALDALELDRLGRQRPAVFRNGTYEVLFCSSLLVSMFMAVRPPHNLCTLFSRWFLTIWTSSGILHLGFQYHPSQRLSGS